MKSLSENTNGNIFNRLVQIVEKRSVIEPQMYDVYDIKRGLRNKNGTGVLVGITRIGSVIGYDQSNGKKIPAEGELYYQGIALDDIVQGFQSENRLGFEEVIFLLLFGDLPSAKELKIFGDILEELRELPPFYKEDVILKIPTHDIMNKIQRNILSLYSYDDDPDNVSISNVLLQSMSLIAKFPVIMAYCFQAKRHYLDNESLVLHQPPRNASTAETILSLVRKEPTFTKEEVELLDLLLVVHAEHGGGNNSAFATHVVSSTGTDTYSAITTAIGSLKGPKHGGAALKVAHMFKDAKETIQDLEDEDKIRKYIQDLLACKAYDRAGLVYGMGHAVYTLSDPRSIFLQKKAREVAKYKGEVFEKQLDFLQTFERIASEELDKKLPKGYRLSSNVDFYSGFVYEMLGFPEDLYTPLFATARMAGWCAHRLEQISDKKIIRPGYVTIGDQRPYLLMDQRKEFL